MDDLTSSLLDLAKLLQVVPEAGLGDHDVGSEDAHAVKLGRRVLLGRKLAANHLIFVELLQRQNLVSIVQNPIVTIIGKCPCPNAPIPATRLLCTIIWPDTPFVAIPSILYRIVLLITIADTTDGCG